MQKHYNSLFTRLIPLLLGPSLLREQMVKTFSWSLLAQFSEAATKIVPKIQIITLWKRKYRLLI